MHPPRRAVNATEIGSALSAQHGGMSRRGHSRFARNKTRDTNLVCCAHQSSLDTAALVFPIAWTALYISMAVSSAIR